MNAHAQDIKLEPGWKERLLPEFQKPYIHNLKSFLLDQKKQGKTIYPKGSEIFSAFNTTPFDQVKVVIIGQDPYHGPGQAHGLCFSVKYGIKPPPSLVNIYKELNSDLNLPFPNHGCLTDWATQGVLLLNAVLTVEQKKPASHQGKGWETFTDAAIHALNEQKNHLVFLLWGSYAQKKGQFIDRQKHLVLETTHPSPFSAHRGFLGSKHFSKANEYIAKHQGTPVNWLLNNREN